MRSCLIAIRPQSLRALNEPLPDLGAERKKVALVLSHEYGMGGSHRETIHQRSHCSDEITEVFEMLLYS
jgi:hypothetical protein